MLIPYNKPEEAIPNLIKYNNRCLGIGIVMSMTGSPTLKCGSGKSVTSVGIASMIDPFFTIDKRVALFPSEFLAGIDDFNNHSRAGLPIPGQTVIMDESEISAPSSLWYSFTNRAIFYTLATFRHTKGVAILVTPSLKWIDSRMRTLLNYWAYTDKEYIGGGKTSVKMKLFKISTDMLGENIFFRKIRMYDKPNKRITIFKDFDVMLPEKEILDQYEDKSMKFKIALRRDLMNDVAKFEKLSSYKSEQNSMSLEQLATKIIDDERLRNQLFGGRSINVNALRTLMEIEGTPLKLGEAELLKKMVTKMYKGKVSD